MKKIGQFRNFWLLSNNTINIVEEDMLEWMGVEDLLERKAVVLKLAAAYISSHGKATPVDLVFAKKLLNFTKKERSYWTTLLIYGWQ